MQSRHEEASPHSHREYMSGGTRYRQSPIVAGADLPLFSSHNDSRLSLSFVPPIWSIWEYGGNLSYIIQFEPSSVSQTSFG
jgi:hypothetical protein